MNSAVKHLAFVTLLVSGTTHLAAGQDAVLDWNAAGLDAIRKASTPPPPASRNLAILHTSIYDAVNGIKPTHEHYLVAPGAKKGANAVAAASTAAHTVLSALYPTQSATFDALHQKILAGIADGAAKNDGIAWGKDVATKILAARANDGSGNTAPYLGSLDPGKWRPTISFGNIVRPALLPLWGKVVPFGLKSGAQFRPPEPPALPTITYAIEVLITQYFGGKDYSFRTPEQTEVAKFWGYGPATATPPGHWNQIATAVAKSRRDSLGKNARLYALLNIALADACIVSWDCKYIMGYWRPITAVQLAETDGNPFTQPDKTWMPLLETPPFPEYTSGHSTFSAAAAIVLAKFYGKDHVRFEVGSDDLPNVTRRYPSFSAAAYESGLSRILGGIHFWSANIYGLGTGAQTGTYVYKNLLRSLDNHD